MDLDQQGTPTRGGNKVLKRAMFPSAFGAPSDPVSRADYDRTRAQQKKHNEALIARDLRRTDVLYATLRTTARRPSIRRRSLTEVIRAAPPFHGFSFSDASPTNPLGAWTAAPGCHRTGRRHLRDVLRNSDYNRSVAGGT